MRILTNEELRTENGGASKYVTCPVCGRRRKTKLWERIFRSNRTLQTYMQKSHGLNMMYGTPIDH